MEARAVGRCEGNVEGVWNGLKSCLLEVVEDVCGRSKGRPRHRETWWWNDDVAEAVDQKRKLFRFGRKRNPNGMKKLIRLPHEWRRKRFTERKRQRGKSLWRSLSSRKDVATCFAQLSRWSVKTRILGDGCIKDSERNVVVEQDEIKEVWRKHYEKLLNEEFDWNQESLEVADAVSGPA